MAEYESEPSTKNSRHAGPDCDLCEIHHTHPAKIQMARLHELDDDTSLRLAEIFKVLGDQTRIKLLSLLVAEDEMCVCDGHFAPAARPAQRPPRQIPQGRQRGVLLAR